MEQKKKFIINTVFYTIIAVLILGACKYILPAMMPFLIASAIAAIMQVPLKELSGRSAKKKKVLAVIFCSLFYALLFLAVTMAGMKLLKGAGGLLDIAPAIYNDEIIPALDALSKRIETAAACIDITIAQRIDSLFQQFTNNIGTYISQSSVMIVRFVSEGITGIPGFIVKLVITVVATFFMTLDYDRISVFLKKIIPSKWRVNVQKGKDYAKNVLFIYLKSYSILFSLTFAELSIGFLILDIPYAVILGLVIAVFDILPVLGTGGILLPWAAVLVVIKHGYLAVGILVLYLVITVIRNILEPKIVGKQIGLHPLATLIAMFLGLKLVGVVGMVAFPVALAVFINMERNIERINISQTKLKQS